MVSHRGGLSSGWSLTWVVFHQDGLSSGWSHIGVASHRCGLTSGWPLIGVVSHRGCLSSVWSFIGVVSHRCGLSLEWSLIGMVSRQGFHFSGGQPLPVYSCDRVAAKGGLCGQHLPARRFVSSGSRATVVLTSNMTSAETSQIKAHLRILVVRFHTSKKEIKPVPSLLVSPVCLTMLIIIIMYICHTLINALGSHMIHFNLNMIFYTHVEHIATKTVYVKYAAEHSGGLPVYRSHTVTIQLYCQVSM